MTFLFIEDIPNWKKKSCYYHDNVHNVVSHHVDSNKDDDNDDYDDDYDVDNKFQNVVDNVFVVDFTLAIILIYLVSRAYVHTYFMLEL